MSYRLCISDIVHMMVREEAQHGTFSESTRTGIASHYYTERHRTQRSTIHREAPYQVA